jgi:light-regulated signal transduction histidine kinase (bacteriophytochrome)
MRLADFILRNMEAILAQWEAFAGTLLPAAANMQSPALRDHAQQILEAVAKDLSTAQTREAQLEKSRGRAPRVTGEEEDVRIVVANSGTSIEPLDMEQIFEPLKRGGGPAESYEEDSHLGLGLYIVREIAKAHGGEIELRSGQGETAFAVRLPRTR